MEIAILILTFILIIVVFLLLILSYLKFRSYPPQNLPPDPNLVYCSPTDLLEAYIQNYPPRESCPEFTNDLVVGDDLKLYEKEFKVGDGCCWFSNEITQRTLISNPWICDGSSRAFTLNELNTKPYFYDGIQTIFINPPCDNDPNCISFILAANSSIGPVYKLTKFNIESTEQYYDPYNPPPPLDSSADYAQRLDFIFGESCSGPTQIYLDGKLLCQGNECNGPVPDIVEQVLIKKYYPIAGANPILSDFAANYIQL